MSARTTHPDEDPGVASNRLAMLVSFYRGRRSARAVTPSPKLTARQVLTASLRKADFLAEGHVQALADGILLDLDEHGLTIVASGDVE
ncbi:hypothetical protein AB0F88_40030 [Streptosporangium sp. NPDC023963]|uniref:hypothetical protein n=1 Tax=Streptosporangium sp. NPDC023963 TaxID=3155608 RepID=UPI00342912B0